MANNVFERKYFNRRTFLKGGLATLVGSWLSPILPVWAKDSYPDISVVKGEIVQATRAAVKSQGGMQAFVKPGQKVIIKPNMSFDQPPENATNTHPEVVQALAKMCEEAGAAKVWVLDNPLRDAELCLERSGIKDVEKTLNCSSIQGIYDSSGFSEVDVPQGKQLRSTEVMKEVLEADVLIAAPVAKHHASGGVSLSLKGMMGLILNRGIFHWRYDLHTAIVDLSSLLKADLTVIDASRALTTNGPSGPGKVIQLNTIVASKDMVAADAQVVSMVPWYGQSLEPRQVKHIRLAHQRGLGRMDLENLKVKTIRL